MYEHVSGKYGLLDPYKPATGSSPRGLAADIAITSTGVDGGELLTFIGSEPFVVNAPGEYETHGVLITTLQENGASLVTRLDSEGLIVAHIGRRTTPLTEAELEVITGADILLVPVGGGDMFGVEQALKAVSSVEPRVVIPIGYRSDNDPDAAIPDKFVKELGGTMAPESKTILKKKDLPQEEIRVIVLSKE